MSLQNKILITVEQLKELLHYNPDTGIFTWIVGRGGKARIGSVAGTVEYGYIKILVFGRKYRAHRLAWLYMTGAWPKVQIDHKDLNKSNNRWSNLREADQKENGRNTRKKRNNKSGFKGVYWHKQKQKWRAAITVNYKKIFLGNYEKISAAKAAYEAAALKYHGEFART